MKQVQKIDILLGFVFARRVMPNAVKRALSFSLRAFLEESRVLGVCPRPAAFNIVKAQVIQHLGQRSLSSTDRLIPWVWGPSLIGRRIKLIFYRTFKFCS